MNFPAQLKITDDSGFLAIVNADKYQSFVDSDWGLHQLFNHFVDEMNNGNLIMWATGYENEWTVIFLDKPSDDVAFREFSKSIHVTNGKLFLTNYEDLTMAAQFQEEKIPQEGNAELCINLDDGKYDFTIRQLFDQSDHDYVAQEKINFEIIIQPGTEKKDPKIDRVFWSTK
jgi:hypothetical protein